MIGVNVTALNARVVPIRRAGKHAPGSAAAVLGRRITAARTGAVQSQISGRPKYSRAWHDCRLQPGIDALETTTMLCPVDALRVEQVALLPWRNAMTMTSAVNVSLYHVFVCAHVAELSASIDCAKKCTNLPS